MSSRLTDRVWQEKREAIREYLSPEEFAVRYRLDEALAALDAAERILERMMRPWWRFW